MALLVILAISTVFGISFRTTRAFQSPDQLLQHEDFGQTGGVTVPMAGNIWTNERKPKVKPRKKDLFEPKLMLLLGSDFDSRWMKKTRELEDIKMVRNDNSEHRDILHITLLTYITLLLKYKFELHNGNPLTIQISLGLITEEKYGYLPTIKMIAWRAGGLKFESQLTYEDLSLI